MFVCKCMAPASLAVYHARWEREFDREKRISKHFEMFKPRSNNSWIWSVLVKCGSGERDEGEEGDGVFVSRSGGAPRRPAAATRRPRVSGAPHLLRQSNINGRAHYTVRLVLVSISCIYLTIISIQVNFEDRDINCFLSIISLLWFVSVVPAMTWSDPA